LTSISSSGPPVRLPGRPPQLSDGSRREEEHAHGIGIGHEIACDEDSTHPVQTKQIKQSGPTNQNQTSSCGRNNGVSNCCACQRQHGEMHGRYGRPRSSSQVIKKAVHLKFAHRRLPARGSPRLVMTALRIREDP
jgi:hypothetical protein